jgi:hypothetical protein
MASKKKAAAGAFAAGQVARENPYVRRLLEDPELREELVNAYESARKAYHRVESKGAAKAFDDKKLQRELKHSAESLKSAAETLREKPKKRKGGLGKLLFLAIVGAALAMVVSEDLRKKALDTLFGAEEEYEYTATTTPNASGAAAEPANAS